MLNYKSIFSLFLLMLSVFFCGRLSARPIYIDADSGNTVAQSGIDPWFDTVGSNEIWRIRTGDNYGNFGDLYEGWVDEAVLITTISNLTPGEIYDVYVVFWDDTVLSTWGIQAGLSSDSLAYYDKNNSEKTGYTLPNLFEYRGYLGSMAADSSGSIDVYIDDGVTANPNQARTWYDGVECIESDPNAGLRLFIQPQEDNWVIDSLPDFNPGESTSLRAGYDAGNSRRYYSYVKFHLPEVMSNNDPAYGYENFSSAGLYFRTDTVNSNINLGVYITAEDDWSESSITWNTKPDPSDYELIYEYGPTTQTDAEGWLYYMDLTDFIKAQYADGDFELSLVLKDVSNSNNSTYNKLYSLNAQKGSRPFLLFRWPSQDGCESDSDLTGDCRTDMADLQELVEEWLQCGFTDSIFCN
jgi:hypothetical protein